MTLSDLLDLVNSDVAVAEILGGPDIYKITVRLHPEARPLRDDLAAHKRDITSLTRGMFIDEDTLRMRRRRLFAMNDYVRVIVAMIEVPARQRIDELTDHGRVADRPRRNGCQHRPRRKRSADDPRRPQLPRWYVVRFDVARTPRNVAPFA